MSLKALQHKIRGKPVTLQMDNKAAVAYIQCQGGTRSSILLKAVEPVMSWAELNMQADHLPQTFPDHKWALYLEIFSQLIHIWGVPQIDLFTSSSNCKFLSRCPHPQAEGTDSLVAPWNCALAYTFSLAFIKIQFLLRLFENIIVIAILPYWPRRPWFLLAIQLSIQQPVPLPVFPRLLIQEDFLNLNIRKLQL